MSYIQGSIISILRERSVRRHLSVVVCMIAVATVLAVFWTLHLNGITMTSDDPVCGLPEHTHTVDCYAWVPLEGETEGDTEPEETETVTGTETATETVTETEIATESVLTAGTEAVTEEETETAQVGDTKIINGVEYVYTLICGMEEHAHTDACYESVSSKEDSTAEEVTEEISGTESEEETETTGGTAGIGNVVFSMRSGNPGSGVAAASVGADEPAVTSLTAGSGTTGDTYYFAETTTLDDAAENQDQESYIVYTYIDGTYYIVSADDTLVECEYLDGVTSASSEFTTKTADVGCYCWTENGQICFKCTTSSDDDAFVDYRWTLSGTDSNTDSYGSGTYTLYNSENSVYIAPQDVGISENLTSTGSPWDYGTGQTIANNSKIVFIVDCIESGTIVLDVYDETAGKYLSTATDNNYYWTTGNPSLSVNADDGDEITITADNTYIISVERTDTGSTSSYTISYCNSTGTVLAKYVVTNADITGTSVQVRVAAASGTYDVSVESYVSKESAGTTNDAATLSYTTDGSLALTDVTTYPTISDTTNISDTTTLKGDFKISYEFYHEGTTSNNDYQYVLALYNGSKYIYLRADSAYVESDTSTSTASVQTTGASGTYEAGTSTWRGWMASGPEEYSGDAYTKCYVTVERVNNVITITTVQSRRPSGSNKTETVFWQYTTTILDSSFDDEDITLFLTGLGGCTLTDIAATVSEQDYDVTGYDAYGAVGSYKAQLSLTGSSGGSITATATSKFLEFVTLVTNSISTASFEESGGTTLPIYLANIKEYTVHFDPTNGSTAGDSNNNNAVVNYYATTVATTTTAASSTGSYALKTFADEDGDCYIRIPSATASSNYTYKLQGWYDIYNNTYYTYSSSTAGSEVEVTRNTVMYADWIISDSTYTQMDGTEQGALPEENKLDTSSFITTDVFDYNELVNLYSAYLLDESSPYETYVDANGHAELWSLAYDSTNSAYLTNNLGGISWGFLFVNNKTGTRNFSGLDSQGSLSYALNRGGNKYNGGFRQGILTEIYARTSGTVDLIETLFNKNNSYTVNSTLGKWGSGTIGVNYLGTGNYLFQYDSDTGYYYYDSSRNAAYYYNDRFYLFEYTVMGSANKTTDDFLPFNYPSSADAVIDYKNTNYFFGIKSTVNFYLPDDVGATGGNQTVSGDMVFKFSGDDDVWVYVDGILLLDLGGTHDKVYGEIDFTDGTVTIVDDDNYSTCVSTENDIYYVSNKSGATTYSFEALYDSYVSAVGVVNVTTSYAELMSSGAHTLTMCYMERGGSQSNLAVCMSISPMYSLTLTKTDYKTSGILSGAEFTVYTTYDFDDSGNNKEASLRESLSSSSYTSSFTTDSRGQLTIYGLRPNQTYYLVETKAPSDYPLIYKVLKVVVDSSGNATVTVLNSDGSTLGTETYDYNEKTNSSNLSDGEWQFLEKGSVEVSLGSAVSEGDDYNLSLTVTNDYQYELTGTGGTGISLYRSAGITIVAISITGLLILAFYYFVWVRKLNTTAYKKELTEEKRKQQRHCARMRGHPRERSVVRGHARERQDGQGISPADGSTERSRGTGPGG